MIYYHSEHVSLILPDYVLLSAISKYNLKHQFVKKFVIPEVFYRESLLIL